MATIIEFEQTHWQRPADRVWTAGLRRLFDWAAEREIEVRAGSADLAVLRVPPEAGELVRRRVDGDEVLQAAGAPAIRIEESAFVHLPVPREGDAWPGPEAWIHAARLLSAARVSIGRFVVPSDESSLREQLCGHGSPEHAAIVASDWHAAAAAWETDRAAFWLVRHALGFANPVGRSEWFARAREWKLRVLPAHVNESWVTATRAGRFVRRGLGEVVPGELAERVCEERLRGGKFRDVRALLRRGARAEISRSDVRALIVAGAMSTWGSVPVLWIRSFLEGALWEKAVRKLDRLPRSNAGSNRGVALPFLPHTVIAHNPRPATLRFDPGVRWEPTLHVDPTAMSQPGGRH